MHTYSNPHCACVPEGHYRAEPSALILFRSMGASGAARIANTACTCLSPCGTFEIVKRLWPGRAHANFCDSLSTRMEDLACSAMWLHKIQYWVLEVRDWVTDLVRVICIHGNSTIYSIHSNAMARWGKLMEKVVDKDRIGLLAGVLLDGLKKSGVIHNTTEVQFLYQLVG